MPPGNEKEHFSKLLETDEPSPPIGPTPRCISTTPMTEELGDAAIRLLECLKSPLDSRMLGRQSVREVVYRVLRDNSLPIVWLVNRYDIERTFT